MTEREMLKRLIDIWDGPKKPSYAGMLKRNRDFKELVDEARTIMKSKTVNVISALSAPACTVAPGSATGISPILMTLKPGIPKSFTWDFRDCGTGIHNFVVYVTKPRGANGKQQALPPSTPLSIMLQNLTNGEIGYLFGGFTKRLFGSAGSSLVQVTLLLVSGNKTLDVEVSYTAAFFGPA